MPQNNFHTIDGITKMTLLISMYIRNEMESFHVNHLSDAQMKELNPIIRQAVYNILFFLKLAETDEPSSYKFAAQEIINFQKLMLPDYWEFPDSEVPWKELDELIDAQRSNSLLAENSTMR